ncbi:MAG: acylneuraminate cytidylyltransferase family protein [Phototrophicaceae bacterium]
MEILAIIAARGGSKGIPRKNIIPLAGQPLIAWRIQQALEAKFVNRVIVSTEDEEIATVARNYGAEVPYMRPEDLSGDNIPGIFAVHHMMRWLTANENYKADYVITLQPTSPLCTPDDIDKAITLAKESDLASVVSVCPAKESPSWMRRVSETGLMTPILDEKAITQQRQKLATTYILNGAIYLTKWDRLLSSDTAEYEDTHAYIMTEENSLDVDTPLEWYMSDLALRYRLSK